MNRRVRTMIALAALIAAFATVSHAQIAPYSQDFELLNQADTAALANDGFLVFGNVYEADGTTFIYGYGPFTAPNDGFGFCQIDINQGGVDQGFQQLSIFNDYQNADHATGRRIESNVFQEQTVGAANVGETWTFAFDAKLGNLGGASTASAFIKTIDNVNFNLSSIQEVDMTATPTTWQGYTLSITIDSGMIGHFLQIGFESTASFFESSGIFYDNLNFFLDTQTNTPSAGDAVALGQNFPNPFNPSTQIDFVVQTDGPVKIDVYDLAGRRVATLQDGALPAGEHSVRWNGIADDGSSVASGRYQYVLETAGQRISRSMVLVK